MVRAWLLVLALVLAGCAAAPPPTEAPPSGPFSTLVAALESGIGEASLAVTPDGNVTIVAVAGPVHAWRGPASGGGPWEEVAAPEGPGDTDLAQAGGMLHHVGLVGGGALIPYQRSNDGGRTWTDVVELATNAGPVGLVDRQWIAAGHGRMAAAFGLNPAQRGVYATLSDDGGESWSEPSMYAQAITQFGDIAVDPTSGRVYTSWAADPPTLHVSATDDGATWTDAAVAPMSSYNFPALAVDASGTVYAVWSAPLGGAVSAPRAQGGAMGVYLPSLPTHAYLSVSKDHGATWSAPLDMTAEGTSAWYPTIAAGAAGQIVVAWYEIPIGPNDDKGRLALAVSDEGDAATPAFVRMDPTPEPVPLGISCESENACASKRNVGEVLEVTMRPDDAPAVAWIQVASGGVEVHYASPSRNVTDDTHMTG